MTERTELSLNARPIQWLTMPTECSHPHTWSTFRASPVK